MGRYDNDENYGGGSGSMTRQKDLVLATNEFVLVQSRTNGQIKTYTGPIMLTISAQESLVTFNAKTKRFEETSDFEKARQLFASAPEGWYIQLKNPTKENSHPEIGKASNVPELEIGKKINIAGPASFSLYPGQMAKVVKGHRLRSNQYLLARVYDAEAAEKSASTIVDAEGKEVTNTEKYFVGQLLVIKGTEVSFYMPPTGIEVLAVGREDGKGASSDVYVRDAVTLERLEYAILKDEDGEKRYVHGPAVVFPKPTETFVESPSKTNIFRALELSPISGIYVKVIAEYEENGVKHPVGEELFITGKDQMIYYPRPEHAMIQYDGKFMHHAIAIPAGEGRYILDRLKGEIKTVKGPAMYLPDPRTEVVVRRRLSSKECELFYPGNMEVLDYNMGLNEKAMEKAARRGTAATTDAINAVYSTQNQEATLALFEVNSNISRGVSYTKPRTITLDTKYEGVVAVDVWTGYAVNVVSKSGSREVVVGPQTRLLDYEETLEAVSLSTGKPKTTDNLIHTAYLRIENNKVTDVISAQTSDYVNVNIKLSYDVNFLPEYKDKWFAVDNYVKHLCDNMRSIVKNEVKKYSIQDFYSDYTNIIRNIVLNIDAANPDRKPGRLYEENGMFIYNCEVLQVAVESRIAQMLDAHQVEIIQKTLQLSDAEAKMQVVTALAENEKKEAALVNETRLYKESLEHSRKMQALAEAEEIEKKERAAKKASRQAELDLQAIVDKIEEAKRVRRDAEIKQEIDYMKQKEEIAEAEQAAYAATVEQILKAVAPGMIEAMNAQTQAELVNGIGKAVSPYAMANGSSVSDTVNTMLRGTAMEKLLDHLK